MKKLVLLLAVSFAVPALVFGQNQAVLPNAGITPESPFYFLDRLGETLQEFFAFNPEGKARLQITFAAERVAEIKVILETKGVEARGLDVAQSRLQANLAKAATIVADQKSKGKNVSELAKELDEDLETPKSALSQTFKEQKRALKAREDELKDQLRAAHRAGATAQEEALAAELGQVKAQLELIEVRAEDAEDELEAEEEKIEEEMEARDKAEKALQEAEKEKQEVLNEAGEEGVELPADAFARFDALLLQARSAFEAGDYQEARRLAKEAEDSLEAVEDAVEELEEQKELQEEAEEDAIERIEEEQERQKEQAEGEEEDENDEGER